MRNEFAAIIQQAEGWFIAYRPEVAGANGQGRTREEARASLGEAIRLILEDRREDALRAVPAEAERGTVVVEPAGGSATPSCTTSGGTGAF